MIEVDGVTYYVYVIFHTDGGTTGIDARSPDEVEALWLSRWRLDSERATKIQRELARAHVQNMRLEKKDASFEGSGEVDLCDVAGPPTSHPIADELFRLNGIPSRGNYGHVSLIGAFVRGISHLMGARALADAARGIPKRARKKYTGSRGRVPSRGNAGAAPPRQEAL